MLTGNLINEPIVLLAIDPGTDTLGISLFEIDVVNDKITLKQAFTFKASLYIETLIYNSQWEMQDEKYLRLHRHAEHLYGLLLQYRPHIVVHESAFMGKFPKAYQGLTECLYGLRLAVQRYSPYLPIVGITPMEVKHYIGGVRKDEVWRAVNRLKDVDGLAEILPTLDEHAVDSIAIGYTKSKQILQSFNYILY